MTVIQLTLILLIVGVAGLLLWFKLKGRVTDEQVRQYLSEGALVVDVRTEGEYKEQHVEGTVNCPLDRIVEVVQMTVEDPEQVILCHCESGGRSAMAVARLKRKGFKNSFNLGSYQRAEALLAASQ